MSSLTGHTPAQSRRKGGLVTLHTMTCAAHQDSGVTPNTFDSTSSLITMCKSFSLDRVVCTTLCRSVADMASKFFNERATVPIAFPILCMAFSDLLAPKPLTGRSYSYLRGVYMYFQKLLHPSTSPALQISHQLSSCQGISIIDILILYR